MAAEESGGKFRENMGKTLTMAFIGLNLLVLGGGVFLVFSSSLGYKEPVSTEEDLNRELIEFRKTLRQKPVFYTMGAFNTNLDGVPRKLIRIEVNLEMLDEEGFEEVISLEAEARDAIMKILNATTYSDVETVQGKLHLKNQIISRFNSFLDKGVVRNVYFSDFVIQ